MLLWHVSACTPHGTVPHHRQMCSCFHKHIGGIGTPVFRNVLKCLNRNCIVHLFTVLASVDVRTEGNGLVQMCATLFNRAVLRTKLLLVLMELRRTTATTVKKSIEVKRRTPKRNRGVPLCNAN
jgi:hypothetical protein